MTLGTKPATAYLIDPYVMDPATGAVSGEWLRRVTISAQGTEEAPTPKAHLSVDGYPSVTGIDAVLLGHEHVLYVDDEGVLPHRKGKHFFALNGYPNPLAGRGIIVGPEIEDDAGWGFDDVSLDFDQTIKRILIGAGSFEAHARSKGDMVSAWDRSIPIDHFWWYIRMGEGKIPHFIGETEGAAQ